MKYLLTFAVVGPRLVQPLVEAAARTSAERIEWMTITFDEPETEESGSVDPAPARAVEQVIVTALDKDINAVAYFRSVMDGWDATHRKLAPWFEEHRPRAVPLWSAYARTGVLVVPPQDATVPLFLPRPTRTELRRRFGRDVANYAVYAVFDALYDGLGFYTATGCTMVLAARWLGGSMDDREYASGEEGRKGGGGQENR